MKLEAAKIDGFLKNPSSPVVLIFGPDAGLVAERALALVKSVIGGTDDAFRYAEISDPARLLEEATATSFLGGRRVIRLREAGESAVKPLETLLKSPADSLVILEAGELTPKSKLRALAEQTPGAVAISCLAIDSARRPGVITTRLRSAGIAIEPDAAAWAGQNIGGEEGAIRQAVEVLHLYAGPNGRLSLADVRAALTDGGDTSILDAIDATITGDPAAADRAVTLAYDEGVSPVAILRFLLAELMRLRIAAASGAAPSEAVASIRPPVFFKRVPIVTRALGLWTTAALTEAIRAALTAEAACKSTLTPDQAYCRQMLLGLASRARAAARR